MQKEWKQKIAQTHFVQFWTWLREKTDPTAALKSEAIKIHSTMSETKAAIAESAIRDLKNFILPLYGS